MIDRSEKIKIVNALLHPKKVFSEKEIWEAVNAIGGKITMKSLGEILKCSPPTVRKSVSEEMLSEFKQINEKKRTERYEKLILSAIKGILDEGAKVSIREVKRRVPVRDHDLLKKIVHHEF